MRSKHQKEIVDEAIRKSQANLRPKGQTKDVLNEKFRSSFIRPESGVDCPSVCVVCDALVLPSKRQWVSPSWLLFPKRQKVLEKKSSGASKAVRDSYRYGKHGDSIQLTVNNKPASKLLDGMFLSPRSCYVKKEDGFVCCSDCHEPLKRYRLPKFAIANGFWSGEAPQCLKDLTEVELAFITPVKTYGYCFCFTGGTQKELKGHLSYFKVDATAIANTSAMFDLLGLTDNIVIVLHGKFTFAQFDRAREKTTVRPEYLRRAIRWLLDNNEEWKKVGMSYDEVCAEFSKRIPRIIEDKVSIVEKEKDDKVATNVEETDSFQVYFPDGTLNATRGGQDSIDSLKHLVFDKVKAGAGNVEYTGYLQREACKDYKENNLVNSCLLQYPFGTGGLNEEQRSIKVNVNEFTEHVSRISNPAFQRELFVLIIYNMKAKQMMLTGSFCALRKDIDVQKISCELTEEDVRKALYDKQKKNRGHTPGHVLLNAVDSVVSALPHTNEFTSKNRKKAEAIVNKFGMPSFFLTVTPDDDNSYFIQIYSDQFREVIENQETLSDQEVFDLSRKYSLLRLKYCGVAAFNFEVVLETVIQDVLGWDQENNCARGEDKGLFGALDAFTITVEEQGRRSLHCHIQIWAGWFKKLRELYELPGMIDRSKAKLEREICRVIDQVCCTGCFGRANRDCFKKLHQCTSDRHRPAVEVVDEQQIRNLRYKRCKVDKSDTYAYCQDCSKRWTNEELVNDFVAKCSGMACKNDLLYLNKLRMKLDCIAVQAGKKSLEDQSPFSVPIAYNHHIHNKMCFKSKKLYRAGDRSNKQGPKKGGGATNGASSELQSSKKRKREDGEECRYRVPTKQVSNTHIEKVSDDEFRWYNWDGTHARKPLLEFAVKRHKFDSFQNMSCPEIGESLFCCNTNMQALIPGPVCFYCKKYTIKHTQKDDTAQHKNITATMQGSMSRIRKSDSDRSEAITRTLAASFAHGSNNVVGAPMASFLTKYRTRFFYSHEFSWCPIDELRDILIEKRVSPSLSFKGKVPYFRSRAMDYLCRPEEFESMSPYEFYSETNTIKTKKGSEFIKTNEFTHPSQCQDTQKYRESVERRDRPALITINQRTFCDSADFSSNLMDLTCQADEKMEYYSLRVLLLFGTYRSTDELLGSNRTSYTASLRRAIALGRVNAKEMGNFLQNFQDGNFNCIRTTVPDCLERCTVRYNVSDAFKNADGTKDESAYDEEDDEDAPDKFLSSEAILKELGVDDHTITSQDEATFPIGIPRQHNLERIQEKGSSKFKSGDISRLSISASEVRGSIFESAPANNVEPEQGVPDDGEVGEAPSKSSIYSVLVQHTNKRVHCNVEDLLQQEEHEGLELREANGSALSILDWSQKLRLDERQRTAFEIFSSTFVLSYHGGEGDCSPSQRNRLIKERRKLEKLARKKQDEQLICFLHGPGGSGKTTVVDLFTAYAKEYCEYFKSFGYHFSKNTICVTALTGVAATLLLGETVHSACHINQEKPITEEQVERFDDTLFLIVDEISFASRWTIERLHQRLQQLKRHGHGNLFGGVHIIFSGDLRQLEPVNKGDKPLYVEYAQEFSYGVNRYLELDGLHRFKDDPEWGRLLRRFRNGEMTTTDIKTINERWIHDKTNPIIVPDGVKYAVFMNKDRDAINATLFDKYAEDRFEATASGEDMCLVYMSDLKIKRMDGSYTDLINKSKFYGECSESDLTFSRKDTTRMDPVLRLVKGCEVMLTSNFSVSGGIANGTRAIVEAIILREGVVPVYAKLGTKGMKVAAVTAAQIDKIRLRHCNNRIEPATFHVCAEEKRFNARFETSVSQMFGRSTAAMDRYETVHMCGVQFSFVINHATTGHKLQGASVDNIFVHAWHYGKNWPYVVLSRVRKRSGLFLRTKMRPNLKEYQMDKDLQELLHHFQVLEPTYSADLSLALTSYDDILDDESMAILRDLREAKKAFRAARTKTKPV